MKKHEADGLDKTSKEPYKPQPIYMVEIRHGIQYEKNNCDKNSG